MARARRKRRLSTRRRRRGGIYIVVVGVAMIVSVLALGAILVRRIERRTSQGTADVAEARTYALAAIEIGRLRIKGDSDWRNTYSNGVWEADVPIGSGTYTLEGIDPDDDVLNDGADHPLVLIGTGQKGLARQKMQVTLVAYQPPLDALLTCVHSQNELLVKSGKLLTVTGAPASTNANFDNDGTLDGSVEALSRSGGGTVTGDETIPAPPKDMPDPGLFDMYVSMATEIPYSGDLEKHVLTPGVNTYGGGLDADGLYYLNTGGNDLNIRGTRIHGTLVVDAGVGKVLLDDAAFLHNYRPYYPTLIVKGMVDLQLRSGDYGLGESTWSTNFNPSGAPYEGASDDDHSDTYPNEVRGLVHVTGALKLKQNARVLGVVICEDTVDCQGTNEIIYAPELYENPPQGYRKPPIMKISSGTWKQVVD